MKKQFDFEQKYQGFMDKIEELKQQAGDLDLNLKHELLDLESKMSGIREARYQSLSPWERVLLSRHPDRPGTVDYIKYLCEEWIELHGDRLFSEDRAICGGIGLFQEQPVTVLGHRKGKNTRDNLECNFGMPSPEGYRKVERLLLQAEKFNRPVITFIDTPGAYPGVGAEERGQALAIAQVLMTLAGLRVPVIAIVTGEGGSGGALALAVSDHLIMLSNAVFSVASPEACASILWKNLEKVEEMASALKLTAPDLLRLGIIDEIIEEPVGGANLDFETTATRIRAALMKQLPLLMNKNREELIEQRYARLRSLGSQWVLEQNEL
ncbi:acetyl-CoA carboxylase carboxyltransferase subunit alpha [Syntrophomonas palmitatica]|uniref:acetyl-CoA carboxylase carboxyltransferase subunit alpha n=1 Tax=Syntrophomonas palmitatica TaxID=402877 RepID=UPI0006D06A64|nr:acetyl-CoA carboxylase carboxyltransferase subunit alpha [Syntrophomonas palmitatica]